MCPPAWHYGHRLLLGSLPSPSPGPESTPRIRKRGPRAIPNKANGPYQAPIGPLLAPIKPLLAYWPLLGSDWARIDQKSLPNPSPGPESTPKDPAARSPGHPEQSPDRPKNKIKIKRQVDRSSTQTYCVGPGGAPEGPLRAPEGPRRGPPDPPRESWGPFKDPQRVLGFFPPFFHK